MPAKRRAVLAAIPVAVVLGSAACTSTPAPRRAPRFFTTHEAAVLEDATARIAPGPRDDPAEAGHPGAREADVAGYIDNMLSALPVLAGSALAGSAPAGSANGTPMIFAGGPWSNRHTSGPDMMAQFVPLDPVAQIAWRKRITGWQQQYRTGIAALDKLAGGDFTKVTTARQDKVLASASMNTFRALLFEHTIEGLYSVPEYGGNRDLAGWTDISYPGDSQPRGYTAAEVADSDGPDLVTRTSIVTDALQFLGVV
jgi:Gluconate 2-dehydrogenase subunit 3